ncbi:MAG: HDOD domain-containing protein [Magnetococcus sp. DMHC-6]
MKKQDLKQAQKVLKGITLPSRPNVMLNVIKALNEFAPDLRKVIQIVSQDMVLSSHVLTEANTQISGFRRQVASIEQAMTLLGIDHIRKVVARQFLRTTLIGRDGPLQDLRFRGVETGLISAYLARELPKHSPSFQSGFLPSIHPDEAYVLGLFHDCGQAVLMQRFPGYELFQKEIHRRSDTSLVAAEMERYATNHCLVGYLLCESWSLPEHLCEVVAVHHQSQTFSRPGRKIKDRQAATLQGILNLAEFLSGEYSHFEWEQIRSDVCRFFDMEESEIVPFKNQIRAYLENSANQISLL